MSVDATKVAHNRFGLWTSSLLLVLGLVGLTALFYFLAVEFPAQLTGLLLVAAGLVLALVPALLWLAFFYLQDRFEPEPKHHVLGVFVLGGLLAAAVGQPVVRELFRVQDWMTQAWWVNLLASVLIVGFVQEFLKLAAVRFSIYHSSEFDERVDGVIYGVAAGLGYATVLNFGYVLDHGGVDLGVGSMVVVVNALAHASFAGITGYFLGQAKFETTPAYWLPLGLTIAAALNGLFFFLEDLVTQQGMRFTPQYGVVLAAAFALGILTVVFFLIRRANAETLAIARYREQQQAAVAGAASEV
ncbi:MAG: PrsW family glutamic-type intramembrane protease [Caldilineales bacterium]|nr:PrsW family glutamic-type intramembrane protease [Caldilineales bacterium]